MRKQILIVLTIISFLIAGNCIMANLHYHSVYYAKHMPHDEMANPELVMVMSNLKNISQTIPKDIKYSFRGMNQLETKKFFLIKENKDYVLYSNGLSIQDSFVYRFDSTGRLSSYETNQRNISSTDEENKGKRFLSEIMMPIVEAQSEPPINFQWLFNLIYERDFK